jgi:hypothetical protein
MRFFLDWAPITPRLIEVSARAAGNSPPTASAVETAATKNEHEDDDDQKGPAIHGSLLAETKLSNLVGLQTSAPSALEPRYISLCALPSSLSTQSYETVHCGGKYPH